MTQLARYVTLPFLIIPVMLLLLVYDEHTAGEFLDSVNAFFDGL